MPLKSRLLTCLAAAGVGFAAGGAAWAQESPPIRPIPPALPELRLPPIELATCHLGVWYARHVDRSRPTPVLQLCPRLRRQMIWEKGNGERVSYDRWTLDQRRRFNAIFQKLMRGEKDLGLRCPDPITRMSTGPRLTQIYLSEVEAFDVYAAHVAHALVVEIQSLVPWSILELPSTELRELFASYNYHSVISAPPDYPFLPAEILPGRDFELPHRHVVGDGLQCDPRAGYEFIRGVRSSSGIDLLQGTPEETLVELSDWLAENVAHGGSEHTTKESIRKHALLQDRLRSHLDSRDRRAVAAAGCHSASNLLHDLARSINIPLLVVTSYETPSISPPASGCNGPCHRGLAFRFGRRDARILWHVDDLYANQLAEFFPIKKLDGEPPVALSAPEKKRLFFDLNWVPPMDLVPWGFRLRGSVPEYAPFHHRVDLNLGTWGRIGEMRSYEWEKRFQFCNWGTFLSVAGDGVGSMLDSDIATWGPLRLLHTREDFVYRSLFCLSPYGGYSGVSDLNATWEAYRGHTVWKD